MRGVHAATFHYMMRVKPVLVTLLLNACGGDAQVGPPADAQVESNTQIRDARIEDAGRPDTSRIRDAAAEPAPLPPCGPGLLRCGRLCESCPSDPAASGNACEYDSYATSEDEAYRCYISSCASGYYTSTDGRRCVESPPPPGGFVDVAALGLSVRPADSGKFATSLALSPDGLRLAVGDSYHTGNGALHVFSREDTRAQFATIRQTILAPQSDNYFFGSAVAWSPNDLELAVGDGGAFQQDGRIFFYRRSAATNDWGTPAYVLTGADGNASYGSNLAWRMDGLALVTSGTTGYATFSIFRRPDLNHSFATPANQFVFSRASLFNTYNAIWNSDATVFLVGDRNGANVAFYPLSTRDSDVPEFPTSALRVPQGFFSGAFGKSLALSADNLTLVVSAPEGGPNHSGFVYVYVRGSAADAFSATPTQVMTAPAGNTDFGNAVLLSPDGHELYIADSGSTAGTGPGTGVVWLYTRP